LTQDHTEHDLDHKEIERVKKMPLKINEVIDAKIASSFPPRRWARLHLMPRSVKIHVISGFFQSELNSTTLDLNYYLERSAGFAIVTCMLQLSNLDLLLQPLLVTGMPPIPSSTSLLIGTHKSLPVLLSLPAYYHKTIHQIT
jgi:hypothetical protein